MSIFNQSDNQTAPRLQVHYGEFITPKYNKDSVKSEQSSSKWYTENSEYLPTGYVQKQVQQHHFNQEVNVILPGKTDATLQKVIKDAHNELETYHKVCLVDCSLWDLVVTMQQTRKSEDVSIYGLTPSSSVSQTNVVSIVKQELVFSVDKDTYQSLGITGKTIEQDEVYTIRVALDVLKETNGKLLERLEWVSGRIARFQFVIFACKGVLPVDLVFPDTVVVTRNLKYKLQVQSSKYNSLDVKDLFSIVERYCTEKQASIPKVDRLKRRNVVKKEEQRVKKQRNVDEFSFSMDDGDNSDSNGDNSSENDDLSADEGAYQDNIVEDQLVRVRGVMTGDVQTLVQFYQYFGIVITNSSILKNLVPEASGGDTFAVTVSEKCVGIAEHPIHTGRFHTNYNAYSAKIRGVLCPGYLLHLIKQVRYIVQQDKLPYAIINVQGMQAPMPLGDKVQPQVNHLTQFGHTQYTLVILANNKFVVFLSADGASQVM